MKKTSNTIFVRFEKEGIHKYPAAATDPKLAQVQFLASPHRHLFKFQVKIEVFHNDRDIEFILFKRWLQGLYESKILELDYKSCEMMADDLANIIKIQYPGRKLEIEVSEDGENGCYCTYEPKSVDSNDSEEVPETLEHLIIINTDAMGIEEVQAASEKALRQVEIRLGLHKTRKKIEVTPDLEEAWDKVLNTLEEFKADESIREDISTNHGIIRKVTNHLTERLKDGGTIESKGVNDLKNEIEKLLKDFLLPAAGSPPSSSIASPPSDKK